MTDYVEYMGLIEDGNFTMLEPPSAVGLSLRFTQAGMQASFPPEREELDLREYEGKALRIGGYRSGDWVWSAQVIDKEVLLPANARSPLGTNLTAISDWSREWCFSDAFKASCTWISGGCELRLLLASDDETQDELIREFEQEFEIKKHQCALLIVRAASDPERWTLAGFDGTEAFRTVVLDDPTDELLQELTKEPPDRRMIAQLAARRLDRSAWDDGRTLDLDENGWVQSLQDNQITRTVLFSNMLDACPSGRYFVHYQGSGVIEYRGSGTRDEDASQPGRDALDVDASRSHRLWMDITSVDRDDHLRDIRVIVPGGTCHDDPLKWCLDDADCDGQCVPFEDDTEQIFHPRFLQSIRAYKVLRFMNWMVTNGSQQREWSDRPKLNDLRWSQKGVPLEVMLELANRLQADPWFCMPHLATDEYVQQFATLVFSSLGPNIRVYVEHSNEVWNDSFAQARYASEQGRHQELSNDETLAQVFYHAKRSQEIFRIWRAAFGAQSDRVVRVMGAWADNAWISERILEYNGVGAETDALAIAPYFGIYLGEPDDQERVSAMGLDELFEELETVALPQTIARIREQSTVARQFNVDLIAYEGGQHLAGVGGVENNETINALFDAANRDLRMGAAYRRLLDGWRQEGGKLFVHYRNCSAYGKSGRWGALEYLEQERSEASKFDALQTFIEENTVWW